MLSHTWGNPDGPNETAEKREVVSGMIADWLAEFEKRNEVMVRIVLDTEEYAALRLAMQDEFKSCSAAELVSAARVRNSASLLKMGSLWTAEVFVSQHRKDVIELLGALGTNVQKLVPCDE